MCMDDAVVASASLLVEWIIVYDLAPRCDVERAGCVWNAETLLPDKKSVSEEERR